MSKILYRPQRGGLSESMAEVRQFDSIDDMKKVMVENSIAVWGVPMYGIDDIVIGDNIGADDRIGWENTHYVCVKRYGETIYDTPQCVGYCEVLE